MQPKIAYLVDDSEDWDDKPSWQFYDEDDASGHIRSTRWSRPEKVKRIVYWEVEEVV